MDVHRLPPGCVVLEGPTPSLWGRLSRWRLGSPWGHCWFLLDAWTGIEATIQHGVHLFDPLERFNKLEEGRAFLVVDSKDFTDQARLQFTKALRSFVGHGYDWGQWLWYGLTRSFWNDGMAKVICSRLGTAAAERAFNGWHFFKYGQPNTMGGRGRARGWVTPPDFVTSPNFHVLVASPGVAPYDVKQLPAVNGINPWADRYPVGSPRPPKP